VRQQLHGLDVYEQQEGQRFVDINAEAGLRIGSGGASTSIARWYEENRPITAKQELATELYCSASFDAPYRSRFLTLMTSVEALLDHQPRPTEVIAVVEGLEKMVTESTLNPKAKQSLRSSLAWLHQESIGQAGRRVASTLLPGATYRGVDPGKYFRQCYDLRSTIVHSGRVPSDVDLLEVVNQLHGFVGDLLHAAIGIPTPEGS
jgi:hypothetical protein